MTRCIKTVTPDGITTIHKYSEYQMDYLARINKGRTPQGQIKYDLITCTDEELLQHGILTPKEAKESTNKMLAAKDAEIEALKKQIAESSTKTKEVANGKK